MFDFALFWVVWFGIEFGIWFCGFVNFGLFVVLDELFGGVCLSVTSLKLSIVVVFEEWCSY